MIKYPPGTLMGPGPGALPVYVQDSGLRHNCDPGENYKWEPYRYELPKVDINPLVTLLKIEIDPRPGYDLLDRFKNKYKIY